MTTIRHTSLISGNLAPPETRRLHFSGPIAAFILVFTLISILGLMLRLTFLHQSVADAVVRPSRENRFIAESYRGPASFLIGNEILDAAKEAGSRFDAVEAQKQKTDEFAQQLVSSNIELISFNPSSLQRLQTNLAASPLLVKDLMIGNIEKRLKLLPTPTILPQELKLRQVRLSTGVVSTLQFEAVDKLDTSFDGLTVADIAVTNADGVEYPFFAIDQVTAPLSDFSIVVLVDKSSSMAGDRLLKLQAALELLISNCSSTTRLEIVGFDSKVTPLTSFTNDHRVLTDAVRSIKADGATEISKALDHGLTAIADKLGSRLILLCTDGQDSNLASNMQRIVASCQRSKVSINVLGLDDSTLDRSNLAALAKQTNGLFCVADNPLAITDQMNRIMSSFTKVAYRLFVFNPNRKMDRYRMRLIGNPTTFIDVQP